jgi:type I restriction enzyme M protein
MSGTTQPDGTPMAIDISAPLSLKDLGDHLWESENLFRNKISNQKDYVLALLFFKRACDRYAEETAAAIEDLADVPGAEEIIDANPSAYHAILIPEGCFWTDVRDTDLVELGKAVNDALAGIGRANPQQLSGVFESIDFNNKTALPAQDLSDLLDHFEALGPLTNERCPADLLGQAYEWTIAKFAANAGKRGGEFYTPAQIGKLGARLLAPQPGEDVYDPTCGSGGLLLQALAEGHRLHGDKARSISLFGQELNPETWAIARMNMLLHGAGGAATVVQGDTLAAPAFLDGGELRRFDAVIANPPFSSKNWGHDRFKAEGDPFGRLRHIPKKAHGEMAFLQHMVASLDQRGRMAVVLPNGCFFRKGAEQLVRKDLIDADLVEAIVQLPKDMFYGAGIPACWLVLNKVKTDARRGRILFIDASDLYERVATKNVLRDTDIDRIVEAFHDDDAQPGFTAYASIEDVVQRAYNLTVRRYVQGESGVGEEVPDLNTAVSAYQAARQQRATAEARLDEVLARLERPE